jgi:hypothetical protein
MSYFSRDLALQPLRSCLIRNSSLLLPIKDNDAYYSQETQSGSFPTP